MVCHRKMEVLSQLIHRDNPVRGHRASPLHGGFHRGRRNLAGCSAKFRDGRTATPGQSPVASDFVCSRQRMCSSTAPAAPTRLSAQSSANAPSELLPTKTAARLPAHAHACSRKNAEHKILSSVTSRWVTPSRIPDPVPAGLLRRVETSPETRRRRGPPAALRRNPRLRLFGAEDFAADVILARSWLPAPIRRLRRR